jgi:hypothetical protein
MLMKLTKTRLTELWRQWTAQPAPPPHQVETRKLVHRLDLTIDATCPCGSDILHHLTLVSTSECPRCGRTIAIRSFEYFRSSPASVPDPIISIGWVVTQELLRSARTRGVH